MPTQAIADGAVAKIVVRIEIGDSRMAATDDPMFLRFEGPSGREFRLAPSRGKGFRRGASETYVLAAADDPETNVAHAELNDPAASPLPAASLARVLLRKSMEPIPNVRGLGEMDDRVQIETISVEIETAGSSEKIRWERKGPCWLGLVCGLVVDLERVAGE